MFRRGTARSTSLRSGTGQDDHRLGGRTTYRTDFTANQLVRLLDTHSYSAFTSPPTSWLDCSSHGARTSPLTNWSDRSAYGLHRRPVGLTVRRSLPLRHSLRCRPVGWTSQSMSFNVSYAGDSSAFGFFVQELPAKARDSLGGPILLRFIGVLSSRSTLFGSGC